MKIFNQIIIIAAALVVISCKQKKPDNRFAQYDPIIWEAMLEKENGNHEKALELFMQAFRIIPNDTDSYYFNAVESALKLGRYKLAKELLSNCIRNTNPNKSYFDSFEGFNQFRSHQIFQDISSEYQELVNQYYKSLPYPKSIDERIEQLNEADQNVRSNGEDDKRATIDSINIQELISITKQYGWINKAWIILWHQRGSYRESNYVWNHFKPLIDKEIEEGKIRKQFWALYEDEQLIRFNGEQLYGKYQNQFPIREVESVDDRRWEVGLPPMWYNSKVYGWELPDGYPNDIHDIRSYRKWILNKQKGLNN